MEITVRQALNKKYTYLKIGYPFSIITKDKTYNFTNIVDIKNQCTRQEWDSLQKMNVKETRMYFEEFVIETE